jgi:hypothetical protein
MYPLLPPTKEGKEQAEFERRLYVEAAEFDQRQKLPEMWP